MDNREIGTRIRLARRDAGLTQEKLAEKIGVSTVFVSQLESGSRAPGLETLVKLSQTLHVSLDLLVLGGAPGGDAEACLAALVQGRSPRQRMLAVSLVRSLFAEMDRLDAEPPECGRMRFSKQAGERGQGRG